jgi:hypothetical protein
MLHIGWHDPAQYLIACRAKRLRVARAAGALHRHAVFVCKRQLSSKQLWRWQRLAYMIRAFCLGFQAASPSCDAP